MVRRYLLFLLCAAFAVATIVPALAQFYTDPFTEATLDERWTWRSHPDDDYILEGGWITFDLTAPNRDMYIQGIDNGAMLLTDPPTETSYSFETVVDVLVNVQAQPNATHAGLIMINLEQWAYTLWGPYSAADIRVEDCIGGSYRWRDQIQIAVDERGDEENHLRIVKDGDDLIFFYRADANDTWIEAGTDTRIGPELKPGAYDIGLFVKSWGGSPAAKMRFDYFHSPELGVLSVEPVGKAATTWGHLKKR